jgi:hypothetical protein
VSIRFKFIVVVLANNVARLRAISELLDNSGFLTIPSADVGDARSLFICGLRPYAVVIDLPAHVTSHFVEEIHQNQPQVNIVAVDSGLDPRVAELCTFLKQQYMPGDVLAALDPNFSACKIYDLNFLPKCCQDTWR